MADDFNDRYKKAASLRLLAQMTPGMTPQQPGTPNYSAIPLNPPPPASYGSGVVNALQWLGFGGKNANAAQAPSRPSVEGSPVIQNPTPPRQAAGTYGGQWPANETPMPPAMNLGSLPPANPDAQQYDEAARYRSPAPMPQRAAMSSAPTGADAAFVPPPGWSPPADYLRTQNDADMAGYGGSPRIPGIAPPQPYSHLNPTPSLEEVFRREYAANPMAFGGKFG